MNPIIGEQLSIVRAVCVVNTEIALMYKGSFQGKVSLKSRAGRRMPWHTSQEAVALKSSSPGPRAF